MGAAGRDFHNFNVVYRDDPQTRGGGLHRHPDPRHRPAPLPARAGRAAATPTASPSSRRPSWRASSGEERSTRWSSPTATCPTSSSCTRPRGSWRRGPTSPCWARTARHGRCSVPVISVLRRAHGRRQEPDLAFRGRPAASREGLRPAVIRHPMPYGDLVRQRVQRFASLEDLDRHRGHRGGAGGLRAAHPPGPGGVGRRGLRGHRGRGARRRRRSSSGTGATTTSPSCAPTWRSWWSTRSGPGTSSPTTRAR